MKKVLLTLALAAGMSSFGHAQGVKLGLKAGATLSDFGGEDAEDTQGKPGLHIGGVANFGINDMVSIQPELLFSMKGTQNEADSDNKINLNYLDVPVLLKINAGGLFFELGPQVGFLLSGKYKLEDEDEDIKDAFKTVDFGYAAGLGYQFDGGLNFGLRYNGGIAKISDSNLTEEPKIYNNAFQLSVGYLFGGK